MVHHHQEKPHSPTPRSRQMMKAATSATAGGSFLVLSGLMLTGTVIALAMVTPVLVLFSPVLVPAVITVFGLATGFLTSGGFGLAAFAVLWWMYKCVKGRGADSVDQTKQTLAHVAREMDKAGRK